MDLLKPLLEGRGDGDGEADERERAALPGDEPRALPPSG